MGSRKVPAKETGKGYGRETGDIRDGQWTLVKGVLFKHYTPEIQ